MSRSILARIGSAASALALVAALLVAGAPSAFASTAEMVVVSHAHPGAASPNTVSSGNCGTSYIHGTTDGYALDTSIGVTSTNGPILYGAYTIYWNDGTSTGSGIPPNSGTWSSYVSHTYAFQPEYYYVELTGYVETVPSECQILNPYIYIFVPSNNFYY